VGKVIGVKTAVAAARVGATGEADSDSKEQPSKRTINELNHTTLISNFIANCLRD
jgi:hypothetical protein